MTSRKREKAKANSVAVRSLDREGVDRQSCTGPMFVSISLGRLESIVDG